MYWTNFGISELNWNRNIRVHCSLEKTAKDSEKFGTGRNRKMARLVRVVLDIFLKCGVFVHDPGHLRTNFLHGVLNGKLIGNEP